MPIMMKDIGATTVRRRWMEVAACFSAENPGCDYFGEIVVVNGGTGTRLIRPGARRHCRTWYESGVGLDAQVRRCLSLQRRPFVACLVDFDGDGIRRHL